MKTSRYALNKNKYLLPPEVVHLVDVLDRFESQDLRNTLLIRLGLKTGARAQEILNLRKADLNFYDESVFFRGIKNSNDREIPLSAPFFRKLKNYAVDLEGDRLFPITYIRLYQIWDNYRPVAKKFHALRHTFAIQLYEKTKDIRLVQVALGHRNIMNTMVYADYIYSQQELRKLIL